MTNKTYEIVKNKIFHNKYFCFIYMTTIAYLDLFASDLTIKLGGE